MNTHSQKTHIYNTIPGYFSVLLTNPFDISKYGCLWESMEIDFVTQDLFFKNL